MTKEVLVGIEVPEWVTAEILKKVIPVLADLIKKLGVHPMAMRGFLHAAHKGGYPVDCRMAPDESLREHIIRAFWWELEQTFNRANSPGGGPSGRAS